MLNMSHLLQMSPSGERLGSVKHSDVIKAKKATCEQVLPLRILPVHPPVKHNQMSKLFSNYYLKVAL